MIKYCFFLLRHIALGGVCGCSLLVVRPVQEMSYTAAAIRAAREVQADVKAPELFQAANEWFLKAKNEYTLKNFDFALKYAQKARRIAEKAEFEALFQRNKKSSSTETEKLEDESPSSVSDEKDSKQDNSVVSEETQDGTKDQAGEQNSQKMISENPSGIPAEEYEERMALEKKKQEEEAIKKEAEIKKEEESKKEKPIPSKEDIK